MRSSIVAVTLASVVIAVAAQENELVDARRDMFAAAAKGDKAAYGKFVAADGVWIDRAGRLRDRATMIGDVAPASGPALTPATPAAVHTYGNAAVLVGKRMNPDNVEVIYIQAWSRAGGHWQLAAHAAIPASSTNRGSTATKPSSPLPPSAGPQNERDAVQKNIDEVNDANRKGDADLFARSVTDQFVTIRADQGIVTKDDRIREIKAAGPRPGERQQAASTTTIHGNMALTVTRYDPTGELPAQWFTIVTIKQNGAWKRAAIVVTPITGAARPTTE